MTSLAQGTAKRQEAYVMVAEMCAQKLVEAIRNDLFPDEETEKMFGISMNDTANDGLGDLIYNCWMEIYKRRLYHGGEILLGPKGPASLQFQKDVSLALTTNRLPSTFHEWVEEVVLDHSFTRDAYCTELLSRSLSFGSVIHPNCEKHREWMERFRTELDDRPAAAAAPGGGSVAASAASAAGTSGEGFCQYCGSYGATRRCLSCKEVYYCSKKHQTSGWKSHKACCKAINADPVSVWIKVEEGEGNGLGNICTNHVFSSKADGVTFAHGQIGSLSPPLRSKFCELNGWDVEIYCSTRMNDIVVSSSEQRVNGKVWGHMNSAGVYLGSDLNDGFTRYNNMAGPIFVTGRRQADGKPMNEAVLWGIMNFIWDAMDLYDGTLDSPTASTLQRWSAKYKAGTWVPRGGDGGIDVYSNDFTRQSVDHR